MRSCATCRACRRRPSRAATARPRTPPISSTRARYSVVADTLNFGVENEPALLVLAGAERLEARSAHAATLQLHRLACLAGGRVGERLDDAAQLDRRVLLDRRLRRVEVDRAAREHGGRGRRRRCPAAPGGPGRPASGGTGRTGRTRARRRRRRRNGGVRVAAEMYSRPASRTDGVPPSQRADATAKSSMPSVFRSPSGKSLLPKPLSGWASGSEIVCRACSLAGLKKLTSNERVGLAAVWTAENWPASTSLRDLRALHEVADALRRVREAAVGVGRGVVDEREVDHVRCDVPAEHVAAAGLGAVLRRSASPGSRRRAGSVSPRSPTENCWPVVNPNSAFACGSGWL